MLVLNKVCGSVNRGGLRMLQKRAVLADLSDWFLVIRSNAIQTRVLDGCFAPEDPL